MKKLIETKAGTVTDVVASIGGWGGNGPILSQSLKQFNEVKLLARVPINHIIIHCMYSKSSLAIDSPIV